MKSIQITLLALITLILHIPLQAAMSDELKRSKETWTEWNKEEKTLFISKQKNNAGKMHSMAPVTAKKELFYKDGDIDDLIVSIDKLYTLENNKHLTIYGALAVVVMELNECKEENITKKLKIEQTRIAWGF